MGKDGGQIAALDKAIDVLEYIYSAGGECSLTAISQGLGIYKSGVHRILSTLRARGFVTQDELTGRYGLGPRLFVLGSLVGENMSLVRLLKPHAQRISAKYGECVNITIPYQDTSSLPRQLLVAKIQNPSGVLTVSPPVGSVTYCHASASGKCMLAFAGEEVVAKYFGRPLKSLTPDTITDWDVLRGQMALIRKQGYATEDGETEIGLSCTAVPCLGRDGRLWCVISISGPTSRIRALSTPEIVTDLSLAARQI